MADMANCVEYKPSARERFWRRLGFRYHLGEHEPAGPEIGKCWSGWMQTRTALHLDWRNRLRLVLTGHLNIQHTFHLDTPSPDKVHTRFDWEIVAPGRRAHL